MSCSSMFFSPLLTHICACMYLGTFLLVLFISNILWLVFDLFLIRLGGTQVIYRDQNIVGHFYTRNLHWIFTLDLRKRGDTF